MSSLTNYPYRNMESAFEQLLNQHDSSPNPGNGIPK
jgi:hypothetical protein